MTVASSIAVISATAAMTGAARAQAAITEEAGILPGEAAVRDAVSQSPDVQMAEARRDAVLARAAGIRAGTAEAVVRATGQGRQVREPSERYAEGQLALERPLRLWGKADADGALADVTAQSGQLAVMDARHEVSRQILSLWFGALRAQQVQLAAQGNDRLAAELATITARRVQLGDAARMDHELLLAERARTAAALASARAAEAAAQAELRARFPNLGIPGGLPADARLQPLPDDPTGTLRNRYVEDSHEFRLALSEETQAQRQARRSDLERKPDPTVGVFVTIERGGAERIAGVSVSMPLGSAHRRSVAVAAAADAEAAARRRVAVERRIGAEFEVLYGGLEGKRAAAKALSEALALQRSAAERTGRAYKAGETSLSELLMIRRALADTMLAERAVVVDTLEADSRLRLDLHQLWDFDD
ncbi:TolC family protein (plasmid) [Cupriavidus sp. KK10]|uniref:TolC family protein n=1 Tax=Cupriavidus sp. KK10 TaxID=1478019 RepID=UPI001BA5E8FF|nr:TolC family protein [Cupriavidus sp. KK10]